MGEMTGRELCRLCPRDCGADRASGRGFCGMGEDPVLARAALHLWEEPCISGERGSGTVFFSGCALRCVYCQNGAISTGGMGKPSPSAACGRSSLNLRLRAPTI